MKRETFFLLSVLLAMLAACQQAPSGSESPRRAGFDRDWLFHLGDIPAAKDPSFRADTVSGQWRKLDLPHDWSIEGKFNKDNPAGVSGGALPGGTGWYRKTFTVPQQDTGKLVFIDFDGVYMNSKVWINGHYLGNRPYGYSSFRYELTPYLHYGKKSNTIAVRVDNSQQPNSRWYSGSGIYRNVWLITTDKIHVDHWGTFVSTPEINDQYAVVDVQTKVQNKLPVNKSVTLITKILDENGHEIAKAEINQPMFIDSAFTFSQKIKVDDPKLWNVHDPVLYKAVSLVEYDGKVHDRYETLFGIRHFHFDSEKGFFLNGKHLKIRGVCDHHDLGCLGAAVNTRAIQRQLELLKGMGCNAIRTSHNLPAPELLQLCDEMGFLVMDEAFDCWKKGKNLYDYHLYWDQWHRRDLSDMIRRDRNHPSVIIWSIGNEIPDQWDSAGATIARELAGIVHELDTTRPITSAMNNPPQSKNNFISHSGALDLIGQNYHVGLYKDVLTNFPGGKFIATETTSALESRGHYDMPSDSMRIWPHRHGKNKTMNANHTCSAYDNCHVPWGATHEKVLKAFRKYDHVSGIFVWTGFDYLGEPTPYGWPSRSSYFGIIDLAGFPKDAYYLYKSLWTDSTVLHLLPSWDKVSAEDSLGWHKGDSVDVWAYYNHADSVELFLNGRSLGVKSKGDSDLHVMWRVAYEPGTLKAVSRKEGKEVKTAIEKTSGSPAKIVLRADRDNIHADGKDLSFITVKVVDSNGVMVSHADNLIHFQIEGPGTIAGVDNGSQTDLDPFKADYRHAFNGMALAVIRSKNKAGMIKLMATSENLQPATIEIKTE